MRDGIEIYEPRVEGYETVLKYASWRIGLITPAERFRTVTYLERHLLTDEAFILLRGQATLLHRDAAGELHRYMLEVGKVYNVPVAGWHNILIEDGALVMVVENVETSRENSEYMEIEPITV